MAGEGEVRVEEKAHRASYSLFTGVMKWGAIVSFVAAAIVVLIIGS